MSDVELIARRRARALRRSQQPRGGTRRGRHGQLRKMSNDDRARKAARDIRRGRGQVSS